MTTLYAIAAGCAVLLLPFEAGVLTALYNVLEARIKYWLELRATNRAVNLRMATPLPAERLTLTEPWPVRQSPSILDAADAPITWREGLYIPDLTELVPYTVDEPVDDEEDTFWDEDDDVWSRCAEPCTAKHCIVHSDVSGCDYIEAQSETQAVHVAWNTKTAEWSVSLLGLAEATEANFRALVGSAT